MEDLLTAQQVQDILQVNRITIYRMLQDGRLKGVKIGQQWRFPANQFKDLFSNFRNSDSVEGKEIETPSLPVHCIQAIQDLYAGLGLIGSVMVDQNGNQITEISNPCELCVLMNSSEKGRQACEKSWRVCVTSKKKSKWFTCHAGLQYMKIPIREDEKIVAYLLTGQMVFEQPDDSKQTQDIKDMARQYSIDEQSLTAAVKDIPVYDAERRERMESWPLKYIEAVEAMLKERSDLVDRLQQIVKISTL